MMENTVLGLILEVVGTSLIISTTFNFRVMLRGLTLPDEHKMTGFYPPKYYQRIEATKLIGIILFSIGVILQIFSFIPKS